MVGLILVACCGVAAYYSYLIYTAASIMGLVACAELTNDFLMAQLPPSAEVVDESCSDFFGGSYVVTFIMSPDELSTFQQQEPVSKITSGEAEPPTAYFGEEFWQHDRNTLQATGAPLESLLYGA